MRASTRFGAVLALAALAACGGGGKSPGPAPKGPTAARGTASRPARAGWASLPTPLVVEETLLDDGFGGLYVNGWMELGAYAGSVALGLEENTSGPNWAIGSFPKWIVTQGCVAIHDRLGVPFGDPTPPDWCVDLSGRYQRSVPAGLPRTGTLELRDALQLQPGTYRLTFELGPPQNPGVLGADRCVVSLDDHFRETFTMAYTDPWRTVSRYIRVCEPGTAKIRFAQTGPRNLHQPDPLQTMYYVNWGCRIDNVRFERMGTGSGPSLSEVLPASAGNAGFARLRIFGVSLPDGQPQVVLRASGFPDVHVPVEEARCAGELRGTVDLRGVLPGYRDIVVTFAGLPPLTLPAALEVQPSTGPRCWADVLAPRNVRAGRATPFSIAFGNRGNEAALGVPLWIRGLPAGSMVEAATPHQVPPGHPALPPIDWQSIPILEDDDGLQTVAMFLPFLPPGGSDVFQFKMTVPIGGMFQLVAEVGEPYYGLAPASPGPGVASGRAVLPAQLPPPLTLESWNLAAVACREAEDRATLECLGLLPNFDRVACGVRVLYGLMARRKLLEWEEELSAFQAWTNYRDLRRSDMWVSPHYFELQNNVEVLTETMRVWEIEGDATFEACFGAVARDVGAVLGVVNCARGKARQFGACAATWAIAWRASSPPITAVTSFDPNAKVGNSGAGLLGYCSGEEPMRYSILFENLATASAPAQTVVVEDMLDLAVFDPDTFQFLAMGFGSHLRPIPGGLNTYGTTIDLRPDQDLLVQLEAQFDPSSGRATWKFTAVDPATGREPTDPTAGFLPPNTAPPAGDGSVLFSVMPRFGLPSGTKIRNKASIVFDFNTAIETPEWINTVDGGAPRSTASASAPAPGATGIPVSWSGSDDASGILDYRVYVAEDGGPYTLWQGYVPSGSAVFEGTPGHTYRFYSVARDQTGNLESKTGFDAEVALASAPPGEGGGGAVGWEALVLAAGALGRALVVARRRGARGRAS